MCTLVSRVQMTFYILTKGHTVPGNQGTHDKLNQIQHFFKTIEGLNAQLVNRVINDENHND